MIGAKDANLCLRPKLSGRIALSTGFTVIKYILSKAKKN
jgi:hypothetical protein